MSDIEELEETNKQSLREQLLATPLSGIVETLIAPSQPSYSPQRALIGLLFLASMAVVLKTDRDDSSLSGIRIS